MPGSDRCRGDAILDGPVRAALDSAIKQASVSKTTWDGRQEWSVPTTTAIANQKQLDGMRALGLLCALQLFFYDAAPSWLHPILFKCLIDGVEHVKDWDFLADSPLFSTASEVLSRWPTDADASLPADVFNETMLEIYLGVRTRLPSKRCPHLSLSA